MYGCVWSELRSLAGRRKSATTLWKFVRQPSMTAPAGSKKPRPTQLRPPLIGSCLRLQNMYYTLCSVLLPTCLIRGRCRLPTRSPGSVAWIRSLRPRPARAEQRAKLCWSRRQNATPNTTRPHGDVTVRGAPWRVTRLPRASHLEGSQEAALLHSVSRELTLNSDVYVVTCPRPFCWLLD